MEELEIKYLLITRISTYIINISVALSISQKKNPDSSEKDQCINNIKLQMLPTGKMWPEIRKYDKKSKTRRK